MSRSERELLKDYEFLLSKLYEKIPPKSGTADYQIPEPEVIRIGSQVVIRNFREIAMRMKRDPVLLARYLQKELAKFLELFVKMYVKCPTCGSIDTRLEKRGRAWSLVCEACGAEQPVKPF